MLENNTVAEYTADTTDIQRGGALLQLGRAFISMLLLNITMGSGARLLILQLSNQYLTARRGSSIYRLRTDSYVRLAIFSEFISCIARLCYFYFHLYVSVVILSRGIINPICIAIIFHYYYAQQRYLQPYNHVYQRNIFTYELAISKVRIAR